MFSINYNGVFFVFVTSLSVFLVALHCSIAGGRILGQLVLVAEVEPEVSAFRV